MIVPNSLIAPPRLELLVHESRTLDRVLPRLEAFAIQTGQLPLTRHPGWLKVLQAGLRHVPFCIEAVEDGKTRGFLPLAHVRSLLFGKFLVSLPYLNYGGVMADDEETANALINRAADLADRLDVRYLELRHEGGVDHPALVHRVSSKVHMRLALPRSSDDLWKELDAKVRNQVRKGQKAGLTVAFGGLELIPEFYAVFSHNMRDLGTPVYSPKLFTATLRQFPGRAEFCVVRAGETPVAASLLLHGWGVSEVPSASSLRHHNHTNANMLMYWRLLERAISRGQNQFDFGRASPDGSTYRFKKQWGAEPAPADWQYYLRAGAVGDMRPDNPRYQRMIRLWQRLPVRLTQWIGPPIVRGIP
jgi:FemAB-related protein (PEP-CTERM system-associated)